MDQVWQVGGALLILAAFVAAQFRIVDTSSWPYLVLNLVGAGVLAVVAGLDADWGFLLLEGVWVLVTAWSIATKLRGGRAPTPSQA
jgi:hypothetical protein